MRVRCRFVSVVILIADVYSKDSVYRIGTSLSTHSTELTSCITVSCGFPSTPCFFFLLIVLRAPIATDFFPAAALDRITYLPVSKCLFCPLLSAFLYDVPFATCLADGRVIAGRADVMYLYLYLCLTIKALSNVCDFEPLQFAIFEFNCSLLFLMFLYFHGSFTFAKHRFSPIDQSQCSQSFILVSVL